MNKKELNELYKACNSFIGKKTDKIGVSFDIYYHEKIEVRRNNVNSLYFNIIDKLFTKQQQKDFYDIGFFIRANDKDGHFTKLIDGIIDTITNGHKN